MCFQSARRCSGNFHMCQVLGEDAGCSLYREQSLDAECCPYFRCRGLHRLNRKVDRIANTWLVLCRGCSQSPVERTVGILLWPGVQGPLLKPGLRSCCLFSSQSHGTGLPQLLSVVKTEAPNAEKGWFPLAFPMFHQPTWWLALLFCWPELLFLVLWLIIDLHIFSVSFILQKKRMEYDLPQITQESHPLSNVLSLPPHIPWEFSSYRPLFWKPSRSPP